MGKVKELAYRGVATGSPISTIGVFSTYPGANETSKCRVIVAMTITASNVAKF